MEEDRLSDISDDDHLDLISEDSDSEDDSFGNIPRFSSHPHLHSHNFSMSNMASNKLLNTSSRLMSSGMPSSSKVNQALPGTSNTSFRATQLSKKALSGLDLPPVKINTMFQAPLPSAPPPLPEGPPPTVDGALGSSSNSVTSGAIKTSARSESNSNPSTPSRKSKTIDQGSMFVESAVADALNDNDSLAAGSLAEASTLTGGSFADNTLITQGSPQISRLGSEKKSKKLTFSIDSYDQPLPEVAVASSPSKTTGGIKRETFTELSSRTLEADEPAHRGLNWKYYVAILQHGTLLFFKCVLLSDRFGFSNISYTMLNRLWF